MQAERQPGKPVDQLNKMHPQQFVLISKAYSDGISLQKDGPQMTKEFSSECILDGSKTFRTAACFVPKLVAKHFVTTLTVGDELTYYESIAFERRTVLQNFSETTNIFIPKDKINKYCSSLLFEPDATKRHFIAGIELLPAQKFVVRNEAIDYDGEVDATECGERSAINGDINVCQEIINGEM